MIRVRIPLKRTVLSVNFLFEKTEDKQQRGQDWPIYNFHHWYKTKRPECRKFAFSLKALKSWCNKSQMRCYSISPSPEMEWQDRGVAVEGVLRRCGREGVLRMVRDDRFRATIFIHILTEFLPSSLKPFSFDTNNIGIVVVAHLAEPSTRCDTRGPKFEFSHYRKFIHDRKKRPGTTNKKPLVW